MIVDTDTIYNQWPKPTDTSDDVREMLNNNKLALPEHTTIMLSSIVHLEDWELMWDVVEYIDSRLLTKTACNLTECSGSIPLVVIPMLLILRRIETSFVYQAESIDQILGASDDVLNKFFNIPWVPDGAKTTVELIRLAKGQSPMYSKYTTNYIGGLPIDNQLVYMIGGRDNNVIIDCRFSHEQWVVFLKHTSYYRIHDECGFTGFLLEDKTRCDGWETPLWEQILPVVPEEKEEPVSVKMNGILGSALWGFEPSNEAIKEATEILLDPSISDKEHATLTKLTGGKHRHTPAGLDNMLLKYDDDSVVKKWIHECPVDRREHLFDITDVVNQFKFRALFINTKLLPDWYVGSEIYELVHGSDTHKRNELADRCKLWNIENWFGWMFDLFEDIGKVSFTHINVRISVLENHHWGSYSWIMLDLNNQLPRDEPDLSDPIIQDYFLYQTLYGEGVYVDQPYEWLTMDKYNECVESVPPDVEIRDHVFRYIL